jgi:hypothetical protein
VKRCLHCGCPAEYSLCGIISTLGISSRRQKCTTALPFCSSCLQRVFTEGEVSASVRIREALLEAYHALTRDGMGETGLRAEG